MALMSWWMDLMIVEIFSSLHGSMILCPVPKSCTEQSKSKHQAVFCSSILKLKANSITIQFAHMERRNCSLLSACWVFSCTAAKLFVVLFFSKLRQLTKSIFREKTANSFYKMNANESSCLNWLCLNAVCRCQCLWLMLPAWSDAFYPIAALSHIQHAKQEHPDGAPMCPLSFPCSTELCLSETAAAIWSEILRFPLVCRTAQQIWSLSQQHLHNRNETGCDSFHYERADEFLSPFVKIKHFCFGPKR